MIWRKLLLLVQEKSIDPYLQQKDNGNDFVRWMLAKLQADPTAGDTDKDGPTVEALTCEYRKAKGLMTHEEHCKQLYPDADNAKVLAIENADLKSQLQALLAKMG